MKTDIRYRSLLAGSLALILGLTACFGPTSTISYRRDKDDLHTTATTTFKLKPDHVYKAALRVLEVAGDVVILQRDDVNRSIIAAKNFQTVHLNVQPQGNASQITITSNPGDTVSPNTDEAIVTMQEVCSELGAPCKLPNQ